MAAYTTIDDPEKYFQTVTYTGNGSTQSITLPADSDMQPDIVWFKRRNDTDSAKLIDDVRGVTKRMVVDSNSAEVDDDDVLTSFNSDGFSVGDDDSSNASSATYVAWCWKESATSGFDMVTYTGNGTGRTISHSLSAAPHMYIIKNRDTAENWQVFHHKNTSAPETDYLTLNRNVATADHTLIANDTMPTSSVFSVGTDASTNKSSSPMIAYLFTGIQGFSKFGIYPGNNSATGPFVYTGFAPSMVIFKGTHVENWGILDIKRTDQGNRSNPIDQILHSDISNAESSGATCDFLSNGFKLRSNHADINTGGVDIVYAAFADAPFVNSNGVPCNAR